MLKRLLLCLAALLAAPAVAFAQAASITIPLPPPSGGLICQGGFVYSYSGPSGTQFTYLLGGTPCTGGPFPFTLAGGTGGGGFFHAYSHVADGPNSIQFQSYRAALDLASIDVEGADRFSITGDADTVGGAGTYFDSTGVDGERVEGKYEKRWRPFEGQRTRALIDLPVQATVLNGSGDVAGGALLSGGLEIPVQPNWSISPRAAFGGAAGSDAFGDDGVTGTVSATSRYRFPQVGRGDLVLGNMIAYTGDSALGRNNVVFRNGIAYQWPLKQMMFGRQVSVRASYVNTYIAGDAVGIDLYHEVALNFGVRLREQDIRNKFEALRFGILYTNASDYNAVTLTVGYRF